MKRMILASLFLGIGQLSAQDSVRIDADTLEAVVVATTRWNESLENLVQKSERIATDIKKATPVLNMADALEQSKSVFVQRSQFGGGSPVIRGLEANRVLLVVDGVRLNSAIFRGGHLQNVLQQDDNFIQNIEVLAGPSSVVHGSDAMGGVIYINTLPAQVKTYEDQNDFYGRLNFQYTSINQGGVGSVQLGYRSKHWGVLTNFTARKFGDLKQGRNFKNKYADLWMRDYYVETNNGIDSLVPNKDRLIQKYSGYTQFDWNTKFVYKASSTEQHKLQVNLSTSSDVPRYDRLTDKTNNGLKYASWYYGPQNRFCLSYDYEKELGNYYFNRLKTNVNYQALEESRHVRKFNNPFLKHRVENLDIVGWSVDLKNRNTRNEIGIGVDGQYNYVQSTARRENVRTGAVDQQLDTRYPDGGSQTFYTGVYLFNIYKIKPHKWILNSGFRVNYNLLTTSYKEDNYLNLPFESDLQQYFTYSLQAGLKHIFNKKSNLSLNLSTAFRTPNVDDAAKVFESIAGAQLIVPNNNLRAEQSVSVDLTSNIQLAKGIKWSNSLYFNYIYNLIALAPAQFNGSSQFEYDGVLTDIYSNQNQNNGYVYGIETAIEARLAPEWKLKSHLTYTYGDYFDKNKNKVPLGHVPPMFGKVQLDWTRSRFGMSAYWRFQAAKTLDRYNPSGEDNLRYATPVGMPAWNTLNFSALVNLSERTKVRLSAENILDAHYRVFASGVSAPGRNFVFKVQYQF